MAALLDAPGGEFAGFSGAEVLEGGEGVPPCLVRGGMVVELEVGGAEVAECAGAGEWVVDVLPAGPCLTKVPNGIVAVPQGQV